MTLITTVTDAIRSTTAPVGTRLHWSTGSTDSQRVWIETG